MKCLILPVSQKLKLIIFSNLLRNKNLVKKTLTTSHTMSNNWPMKGLTKYSVEYWSSQIIGIKFVSKHLAYSVYDLYGYYYNIKLFF